jgi:hypothetical protein
MFDGDDGIAHYQRPPRKGQFRPGQSGNPRGRPKNSRNLKTYVGELLSATIPVIEDGKTKKIPRAKAIAIQLVNLAAKGDPKGLAAVMNLTREFDGAIAEGRQIALSRAEDVAVLEGMIARMRAGDLAATSNAISEPSIGNSGDEPDTASNPDPDDGPKVP